jgi:hypothetical protein
VVPDYGFDLESPPLPLAGVFVVEALDAFSPEAGVLGAEDSLGPDVPDPSAPDPDPVDPPDPSPEVADESPVADLAEVFVRLSVL